MGRIHMGEAQLLQHISDDPDQAFLADGLTEEETRFFGLKRECGLHEEAEYVI